MGYGATVPQPGQSGEERGGKPDPEKLAGEDFEAAVGEESADADRRNSDWAPGQEVAVVVEGGEEGDAEAAVGHGVEKAVAGGGEKEVSPKPKVEGRR